MFAQIVAFISLELKFLSAWGIMKDAAAGVAFEATSCLKPNYLHTTLHTAYDVAYGVLLSIKGAWVTRPPWKSWLILQCPVVVLSLN